MPYTAPIVPKALRDRMRRSNSVAIHRALQGVPVPVTPIPPWEGVSEEDDRPDG